MSTRSLYGNVKLRPPFPRLLPSDDADLLRLDPRTYGHSSIRSCSVCDGAVTAAGLRQVWISLRVATDVLPLLVNACSDACVRALPKPADGYLPHPHAGGIDVVQRPADWS